MSETPARATSAAAFKCFHVDHCDLLLRVHWHPPPVLATTTMSPRRWSQRFARQPGATASTFLSILTRRHPHAGKTTRQHGQKASKPMRHHLQNVGTPSRRHPQNTVSGMRHHQQNTGEQTRCQHGSQVKDCKCQQIVSKEYEAVTHTQLFFKHNNQNNVLASATLYALKNLLFVSGPEKLLLRFYGSQLKD